MAQSSDARINDDFLTNAVEMMGNYRSPMFCRKATNKCTRMQIPVMRTHDTSSTSLLADQSHD